MHRLMTRATLMTPLDLHIEYDEQAFRSLLDFEHEGCLQSGDAFHVLLCRLSTTDGTQFPMNESVKRGLVTAVRESLRKTDPMGWFLQDLVLGALLLNMDQRQSTLSSSSERSGIRRLIERRFSLAHPSLVLQFYEYLDLPPIPQCDRDSLTDRALARPD